jgi:hypothetical protein
MWIAANDPLRMIEANDGGANVSVNGGQTWTLETFPTAQFYHVITTSKVPYEVCGAQQDNSTACVSSQGPPSEFYAVGGGESGYIAVDPRKPGVFYAGSYGGLLTRYDHNTGQSKAIDPYPDNPMGYPSQDIAERFQWTFPIVTSPTEPNVIYAGSQHVWKTTDAGHSWTKISPDLTRHDPSTMGPSGGVITKDETGVETYATVFTIAPSPKDAKLIWTGSDDGYVFVTRDAGANWKNVTPKGMPDFARISLVEASPFRPGTAYVAANHYQRDDFAPYVFRTDDYGETWTPIVSGVDPYEFARAIREDPARAKLLYLGTERGIYVSFDDGAKWQSLKQNLPVTPVHDIKVEARDLVIATHGRSFWVMDNISPLRQMSAEATSAPLYLFKPNDVLRGLDRALAVDYTLKDAAKSVTIDIKDKDGNLIKSFKNAAADTEAKPAAAPADQPSDDEGFRRLPDPKPSFKAGMHRLNWDLRYPGATDFPGLIMWAASTRGPMAPPGTYAVTVTADGVAQSKPFVIRREPTLLADVTDADLQAEFDLAMKVRNRTSDANNAVITVRRIKPQIDDRHKKLDSQYGPTAKALENLKQTLEEVEVSIYQTKNQSGQDPLNYPIKLNNKIAALEGVVESSDSAPTEQSTEIYLMLSNQLDQQLGKLDTAVTKTLPKVNEMLKKQRVAPIDPAGEKPAADKKPNGKN